MPSKEPATNLAGSLRFIGATPVTLSFIMLQSRLTPDKREAGCDEAGRGCLAGPVVAAAVILPPGYHNTLLNDSKKLTPARREYLRQEIERKALAWAVAFVDNREIDQINILNAAILAMHRAIKQLKPQPELLLIDGNRFKPYPGIDHRPKPIVMLICSRWQSSTRPMTGSITRATPPPAIVRLSGSTALRHCIARAFNCYLLNSTYLTDQER